MIEWYKKVVFQNYANFSGRARRSEYWYFTLINVLIYIGVVILVAIALPALFMGIFSLYILAILVPSIAVGVRRMHDVGKSGWFILIPIYNLILAATDGNKGPNEYGPDPKNPETSFDFDNNKFA